MTELHYSLLRKLPLTSQYSSVLPSSLPLLPLKKLCWDLGKSCGWAGVRNLGMVEHLFSTLLYALPCWTLSAPLPLVHREEGVSYLITDSGEGTGHGQFSPFLPVLGCT